jgi:flavin reductase (DIM6/NTAB) family NADH-FMN oxidoreductase RutF
MKVDVSTITARDTYRMMIELITPRPIGWISTLSPAGITNLAPFSFFNGVGASPPTVCFSAVNSRDGRVKDTVLNIEATGEFVVNIAGYDNRIAMNASSEELPYEESEFDACGVIAVASETVKPPRVADAKAHFECVLHQIVRIGEGPLAANLVIGRIVLIHIADDVLDDKGAIDPRRLDTIGRMGGDAYARTTDVFRLPRPPARR